MSDPAPATLEPTTTVDPQEDQKPEPQKPEPADQKPEPQPADQKPAEKKQALPSDLDLRITTKHVNLLVSSAEDILDGRPLTTLNALRCVAALLSVSKKMTDLKGPLKKKALLTALETIVRKQPMEEEEKETLLLFIQVTVDNAVDVLVDVQKSAAKCCVIQ